VLVLKVETEFPLAEPNEDFGFITRLAVTIREFDAPTSAPIGTAEATLIRCSEALNRGVPIFEVLDADSQDLADLYPVFFEDGSLKDAYANGVGMDVIYVAVPTIHPDWHGRKIEEAIVHRVLQVWGAGCAIGILDATSPDDVKRWETLGFQLVEDQGGAEGTTEPLLFIDLSLRQPTVVEADDEAHTFQVAEAPRFKPLEDDGDIDDDDDLEDDDGD
jgi:hypothetical protein